MFRSTVLRCSTCKAEVRTVQELTTPDSANGWGCQDDGTPPVYAMLLCAHGMKARCAASTDIATGPEHRRLLHLCMHHGCCYMTVVACMVLQGVLDLLMCCCSCHYRHAYSSSFSSCSPTLLSPSSHCNQLRKVLAPVMGKA